MSNAENTKVEEHAQAEDDEPDDWYVFPRLQQWVARADTGDQGQENI